MHGFAVINNLYHLNGREKKSINNLSEQRVAEELSRSIIFLAFSEFEGLPVPPVEAALSGNYVIGYDGQGGKEYWHEPNFTRIEQGDIQGFVNKIMKRISKIDWQKSDRVRIQRLWIQPSGVQVLG